MSTKNILNQAAHAVLNIAALMALQSASHAFCLPDDDPLKIYITTGDLHLHGKPNNLQLWNTEAIKDWRYLITFDTNSRLKSIQETINSRCDYFYAEKYLSEIKFNNRNSDESALTASHFSTSGEPDIFVLKRIQNMGAFVSSEINNLTTVKRQDGKISYSNYMPVDDKPKLMSKTINYYRADGFLTGIDFLMPDPVSNEITTRHYIRYHINDGNVIQKDTVSGITGLIVNSIIYDNQEFDACKNWTKRTAREHSVKLERTVHYTETREITYHNPCN